MLKFPAVTDIISVTLLLIISTTSHADDTLLIELKKSQKGAWTVEYKTAEPVTRIVFNNSPNSSRAKRWSSESGEFQIRYKDGHESIHRKDGGAFSRALFNLTPTYTHLPKNYAPFSPLSDGGMIVHSGRFFACIGICDDTVNHWALSLTVPKDEHIILNGEVLIGFASWSDKNSGKSIYVGKQLPVETAGTLSIIDQGLPEQLQQSLDNNIPKLMVYFEEKLGKLDSQNKPTLFASYSKRPGKSSQGGTLPNQIFMHWDFDDLDEKVNTAAFLNDTLKLFAHEAAHFFQDALASTPDAWIHEGSADLFAYNALVELYPTSKTYVESQRTKSKRQCIDALKTVSLANASENGRFDMHYHCGMLIHQRVNEELSENNSSKTVYTLWQEYRERVKPDGSNGRLTFLDIVETYTSTIIRKKIEDFISKKHTDPSLAVKILFQ